MKTFNNINEAYLYIAGDLFTNGKQSGSMARELKNYMFTINDITDNIIDVVPVNYDYMLNETLWYLLARNDLSFVNAVTNTTGFNRTSENDLANSAYGDIIFKRHGYDQVQLVIDCLKDNPESRRATINLSVPDVSRTSRKDDICTVGMQYYIEKGRLCSTTMMRSNDAYGCLPYDFFFFTELQKYIAIQLGIPCGSYTHFALSFHVYNKGLEAMTNLISSSRKHERPILSCDIVKFIENAKYIQDRLNKRHDNIITICKEQGVVNV